MATYNVLDFGATINDTTDDTDAIQAAVDKAASEGGGSVYLPTGLYYVSGGEEPSDGTIMLRDNITFYGDGMGDTIIKLVDGWDKKVTGMVRTDYGVENENIHVYDLTLDGNRSNNSGKVDGWFNGYIPGEPYADRNITLERMEIQNMSGYGFDPHERTINLTIRDSVSHHNGLDGFVADFLIDSQYFNNVAYANDRHGFNIVTSTHDFLMEGNSAYDNGSTGVTVQRGSENIPSPENIIIRNNSFTDNGRAGVELKMSDHITVEENTISGNGQQGIRINGSGYVNIENNTITGNAVSNPNYYAEVSAENYDDTNGVSGQIYDVVSVTISNNTITAGDGHRNLPYEFDPEVESEITLSGNTESGFFAEGPEFLQGTDGPDVLRGGAFDDTLDGGAGKDTLFGGDGNDVYVFSDPSHSLWRQADKIMDFVAGEDLIDFSALNFFTLTEGRTAPGQLRLAYSENSGRTYIRSDQSDFEIALQGDFRELLSNKDFVFGEFSGQTESTEGNDYLVGSAESDTLDGGAGKDTIMGGEGSDFFKFSALTHSTHSNPDSIEDFTPGEDKIDLSALDDFFTLVDGGKTAPGALRLAYSENSDRTYVRSDQVEFEFYLKGDYRGQLSNDDFIFGEFDGDTITSTNGDDVLIGTEDADTLDGGAGRDTLTGGAGEDVFKFSAASHSTHSAPDAITDFTEGEDILDVSSLGFFGLADAGSTAPGQFRLAYSENTDRTYVRSDQSDFEFYLQGDHRSTLSESDFRFGEFDGEDITSTDGDDLLIGTQEADTLDGGAGRDTLTGGAGDDVFKFSALTHSTHSAPDAVTDFVMGEDMLDVSGLGFSGLIASGTTAEGEFRLAYSENTDRTYVRSDQSDFEFYLQGDFRDQLSDADFIF